MKVVKRDGSIEENTGIVEYNLGLITSAITKANNSVTQKKNKMTKAKITEVAKSIDYVIKDTSPEGIPKVEIVVGYKDDEKKTEIKDYVVEIEDIQDLVENKLIEFGCIAVAKNYIKYRNERTRIREQKSELYRELLKKGNAEDVQNQNANVDEHSFGGRKGEMDNVIMTKLALDWMTEEERDSFYNNETYPHDKDWLFLGAHNCMSITFDDLINDYGFNTRQTDVRVSNSLNTGYQMLAVGSQLQSLQEFGGVSATHVDSTLAVQLRNSFYKHYKDVKNIIPFVNNKLIIPGEARDVPILSKIYRGGIFNIFKRYMFYKAVELTIRESDQGAEGLYHNLNTLQSRSGNQLPFTSINYGLDTTPEGRIITNSLLKASMKGLGKYYRTSIFPCGIFQLKNGVNLKPGDPNYDLKLKALESTVKRFYPNYVNCDWSVQVAGIKKDREIKRNVINNLLTQDVKENLISIFTVHPEYAKKINLAVSNGSLIVTDEVNPMEEASTMGCRTYNGFDINFDEKYFKSLLLKIVKTEKLPKNYLYSGMQKDGRGNIAPHTIILPTLAMEAVEESKETGEDVIEVFMRILDKNIDLTKRFLIRRFNHIASQKMESAKFMYENDIMKGYVPEQGIRSALKHGTLAIGQLGLAECLQALIGCDHTKPEGMELAKRIEQLFKDRCDQYKEEYKLNFGVYFTPAENLCYTAYKKFVKRYGLIENVSAYRDENGKLVERGYFTNSIHVPVWVRIDPIEKIDIETQLIPYSSAGSILYIEIDSKMQNNIKGIEDILDYAISKDASYIAFNVPADQCLDCGFIGDFSAECKCTKCGSTNILMPAKVTGYLTGDWRYSFNHGKQDEKRDRFKHSTIANTLAMKHILGIA